MTARDHLRQLDPGTRHERRLCALPMAAAPIPSLDPAMSRHILRPALGRGVPAASKGVLRGEVPVVVCGAAGFS